MNQKWYINEFGTKVKPCASCGSSFPYTLEYFSSRGSGKYSAYCIACEKDRLKKRKQEHKKTNQTRVTNFVFMDDGIEYKKCSKCSSIFPNTFEFFDKSSLGQKGLRADCRKCRLEYSQKFSEKRWAYQLYSNARQSSNKNGFDIDIDEKYILDLYKYQNGRCYWLGVDMQPSTKTKYPFQPSLDRLDRNKGYIRGNVVLCCFVANFGRNENTEESWKQFLMKLNSQLDYSLWNK